MKLWIKFNILNNGAGSMKTDFMLPAPLLSTEQEKIL